MLQISMTQDLDRLRSEVATIHRDQIPFATALALTRTADAARASIRQEMSRRFDRPTPFILASLFIEPATKTKLSANVFVKDVKFKADSGVRIEPEFVGGRRRFKGYEALLRSIGLLAGDEQAVPGGGATLDQYGNISRAEVNQILAWFRAHPEGGTRKNLDDKSRDRMTKGTKKRYGQRYYYQATGRGRGVYKAVSTGWGTAIKPMLMFVRRPRYQRRINMPEVIRGVTAAQFPSWFRDAMQQATSARP